MFFKKQGQFSHATRSRSVLKIMSVSLNDDACWHFHRALEHRKHHARIMHSSRERAHAHRHVQIHNMLIHYRLVSSCFHEAFKKLLCFFVKLQRVGCSSCNDVHTHNTHAYADVLVWKACSHKRRFVISRAQVAPTNVAVLQSLQSLQI